jgi:ABC-type nitrate/sulfonate/bicarbonate transport system substrate-binding protein
MIRPSRRLVLAGLGAAALGGAVGARSAPRDLTVSLASTSFATAAIRAAQVLGLFAARGLNPKLVVMDNANAATSALIAGSADLAVSGPGELIAAHARNQPVVLIADIYRGFGASLVLSKAAAAGAGLDPSAPAPARIKALDGLLIAAPSATSAYTASYKGAAESAGAKIRFTYMGQPAMAAALESGAVQGFIGSAPFWGFPVSRGAGVLWLSGPKGELPAANVPVSTADIQALRSFADANAAVMRQVIDTVREFGALVQSKPEDVKAALAKLYPDIDPATMDVLFAAESRAWVTRPLTPSDMQHEVEFMRASGTAIPGLDRINPASTLYRP